MNNTYRIIKLGADKIALLGLFIITLLMARLIVDLKSALLLSEPIKLAHTGLSVSMPTGNGWQSGKKWKYRDNGFTLGSNFTPGSGRPTFWIYCQYLLAAEKITPEMRFSQKVSEVEGAVVKMGQTQTDTITIDWTHIQKPEIFLNMLYKNRKFFSTCFRAPQNYQTTVNSISKCMRLQAMST
jgi:hypothetical protein